MPEGDPPSPPNLPPIDVSSPIPPFGRDMDMDSMVVMIVMVTMDITMDITMHTIMDIIMDIVKEDIVDMEMLKDMKKTKKIKDMHRLNVEVVQWIDVVHPLKQHMVVLN